MYRFGVVGIGVVSLGFASAALGQAWTLRTGAFGGRIDGIVDTPGSPNTLAIASPGGGMWFTTDNGGAWTQSTALPDGTVLDLQWDRSNPDTLWALTYENLFYTTTFGAFAWTDATAHGPPDYAMPLWHIRDPKPFNQLVYGGTRYLIAGFPCDGIWYSSSTSSFTQVFPFSGGNANLDNCIQAIASDDTTGKVWIATMGGSSHVFESAAPWPNPGNAWNSAYSGLPSGSTYQVVAMVGADSGGSNPNRLVATVYQPSLLWDGNVGSAVYTSSDGLTWTQVWQPPDWDPRALSYPGSSQIFFGGVLAYNTSNFFSSSPTTFGLFHDDIRAFAWDQSAGAMWAASDGANSGSDTNIGRFTWSLGNVPSAESTVPVTANQGSTAGLATWQVYQAATMPEANSYGEGVWAALQDNFSACSDDQGATWSVLDTGAGPSGNAGDTYSIALSPRVPGLAYARSSYENATGTATLMRFTTNANAASCADVVWQDCPGSLPLEDSVPWFRSKSSLVASPANNELFYFVSSAENAISAGTGTGENYCSTVSRVTVPATPYSVYADTANEFYVGTNNGVYYRNGSAWQVLGLNGVGGIVTAITSSPLYSPPSTGTVFAVQMSEGGAASRLMKRTPAGVWSYAVYGGYSNIPFSDVVVDPVCPSHVFASQGYAGTLFQGGSGVWESKDTGSTWTLLSAREPFSSASVASLTVDQTSCGASCRYLWAATYGMGTWRYDTDATTCP